MPSSSNLSARTRRARSAALDAQTLFGYTALHWACVYGHAALAEELILSGSDTSLETDRGKTAWDLAEAAGEPSVLAVFERCAADLDQRPPRRLSLRRETGEKPADVARSWSTFNSKNVSKDAKYIQLS